MTGEKPEPSHNPYHRFFAPYSRALAALATILMTGAFLNWITGVIDSSGATVLLFVGAVVAAAGAWAARRLRDTQARRYPSSLTPRAMFSTAGVLAAIGGAAAYVQSDALTAGLLAATIAIGTIGGLLLAAAIVERTDQRSD